MTALRRCAHGRERRLGLPRDGADAVVLVEQCTGAPLLPGRVEGFVSGAGQGLATGRGQFQAVAGDPGEAGRLHDHRPRERLDRQVGGRVVAVLALVLLRVEIAALEHGRYRLHRGGGRLALLVGDAHGADVDQAQDGLDVVLGLAHRQADPQRDLFDLDGLPAPGPRPAGQLEGGRQFGADGELILLRRGDEGQEGFAQVGRQRLVIRKEEEQPGRVVAAVGIGGGVAVFLRDRLGELRQRPVLGLEALAVELPAQVVGGLLHGLPRRAGSCS